MNRLIAPVVLLIAFAGVTVFGWLGGLDSFLHLMLFLLGLLGVAPSGLVLWQRATAPREGGTGPAG